MFRDITLGLPQWRGKAPENVHDNERFKARILKRWRGGTSRPE